MISTCVVCPDPTVMVLGNRMESTVNGKIRPTTIMAPCGTYCKRGEVWIGCTPSHEQKKPIQFPTRLIFACARAALEGILVLLFSIDGQSPDISNP